MLSPLPAASSTLALPYLGYDPSTFELSGATPQGLHRYDAATLSSHFARRVATEKARQELAVYYYRINHTLAFPLPLTAQPSHLPEGIPGLRAYPWNTWLAWALEERWRLLLAAWVQNDDEEAGNLVQTELAALAQWHSFAENDGTASLGLGHIAGVLAVANQQAARFTPPNAAAIRHAATQLLERDYLPWYAKHWGNLPEKLAANNLHNIPLIGLTRSAQLARAINHPSLSQLDATATLALRPSCRFRVDEAAPHTEGTAYDGFLMDSVTEWLEALPHKAELLDEMRPAMLSLVDHWLAMALPGRMDLQLPMGDVEPEMPFWMTVLARIALWYGHGDGWWFLQHLPADRMPAAALALLLTHADPLNHPAPIPRAQSASSTPNAVVLRSGWSSEDVVVAMGTGRSRMSHLHQDSGNVLIAWQNRTWITDPGYQQYRSGEERDFTVGNLAHNGPVINGIVQTQRNAQGLQVSSVEVSGGLESSATIDLTQCYEGLPDKASGKRHVVLMPATASQPKAILVTDQFHGFSDGTEIATSWHFGTHLVLAFPEQWVRLSDGKHTLWMTLVDATLSPKQLTRHAGSRAL